MWYNVDSIGRTLLELTHGDRELARTLVNRTSAAVGHRGLLTPIVAAQFIALDAWLAPCDARCDGDRFICERCELVGSTLRILRGLEQAEEMERAEIRQAAADFLAIQGGDTDKALEALDQTDALARTAGKLEHVEANDRIRQVIIAQRETRCPNPWHRTAPARSQDRSKCPECP